MIKRVGSRTARGGLGANVIQAGTVDLQQGTPVDGNSHLCIKSHYPKKGLFLKIHIFNHCILYNTVLIPYIFLLCSLQIEPCKGPLNWLVSMV